MSNPNLPMPEMGKNDKETIANLFDVVMKLRKELDYALSHIDDSNIQPGSISANSIKTDSLVVGDNIAMGANATISWDNVDGSPNVTYIDATGVYTGVVAAEHIIGELIQGVKIKTIPGLEGNYVYLKEQFIEFFTGALSKMKIGFADDGNNEPYIVFGAGDGFGNNQGMIAKDANGIAMIMNPSNGMQVQGFMIYNSGVAGYTNGATKFNGVVDFTGVDVRGLNVVAVFA